MKGLVGDHIHRNKDELNRGCRDKQPLKRRGLRNSPPGMAGPNGSLSLLLFILSPTAAAPVSLVVAAGNVEATHTTCFKLLQDLEHRSHREGSDVLGRRRVRELAQGSHTLRAGHKGT